MLKSVVSRQSRSSGKWYFEIRIDDHWVDGAGGDGNTTVRPGGQAIRLGVTSQNPPSGSFSIPDGLTFASYGNQSSAEGSFLPDTPNFSIGDTLGVAVDFEASPGSVRVYVHINGVWQPGYDYDNATWGATACDPVAGTNWVYQITDKTYFATAFTTLDGMTVTLSEKAEHFAYALPAGYNAWRNGVPDVVPPGWFPYETFGEFPQITLINSNRAASIDTSYNYPNGVHGRYRRSTGRLYFEIALQSLSVAELGDLTWGFAQNFSDGQILGDALRVYDTGVVDLFGVTTDVGPWAETDVCGIAFDSVNWLFDWVSYTAVPAAGIADPENYGKALAVYVSRNGTWLQGANGPGTDPATGTAPTVVTLLESNRTFFPVVARSELKGGVFKLNEAMGEFTHAIPLNYFPWRAA